jgi:hypothetical protein
MFRKIIEGLRRLSREPAPVDPSVFGDPVANATGWEPAKKGGANFATHKLVAVTPNRMEFQATLGSKLFSMAFSAGGIMAMGFGCYAIFIEKGPLLSGRTLGPTLMGLFFIGAGVYIFRHLTKPTVFDKTTGKYYKGKEPVDDMLAHFESDTADKAVRLNEIYALQIISEYVRGSGKNSSSFYSYELNLVLKDGRRRNITDHGGLEKLRQDAKTLANFLGRPVWDATEGNLSTKEPHLF